MTVLDLHVLRDSAAHLEQNVAVIRNACLAIAIITYAGRLEQGMAAVATVVVENPVARSNMSNH